MPRPKILKPHRKAGKSPEHNLIGDERLSGWLRDKVDSLLPRNADGLDAAAAEVPETLAEVIGSALDPILREAVACRRMTFIQREIAAMGRRRSR